MRTDVDIKRPSHWEEAGEAALHRETKHVKSNFANFQRIKKKLSINVLQYDFGELSMFTTKNIEISYNVK